MPTPDLPWEGSCRCGQVRLRISAAPLLTMACHCTGCQKMTASAFSLSVAVPAEGFEVTAGEPAIGGLHGASRHFFCPWCMSWLFTRPEGLEWLVNVRTPMLETPAGLPPFIETFTDEKLPWAQSGARRSYATLPQPDEYPGLIEAYAASSA